MRLWIDLAYAFDTTVVSEQHNAAVAAALHWIALDESTRLIGVSTVGEPREAQVERLRSELQMLALEDVLLYAGAPDPRALDAAEALLCLGPLTNMARLARHGVDLPPMLSCEAQYAGDPVAAAIVVNAVEHHLILPVAEPFVAAYPALCGRLIVVGKRTIAVGASGQLVYDDDGEDFVERDLVVGVDRAELERALQSQ